MSVPHDADSLCVGDLVEHARHVDVLDRVSALLAVDAPAQLLLWP